MASLRQIGSRLQGHPSNHTPGVEMPSGPLGIGLSAAQGMALGLRLNGSPARVYAILGDGELNEGAVWEAAMSAPKFKLAKLTAVIDYNRVQLDGTTDEVMPIRDIEGKWRSFGWNVIRVDGHELTALDAAFASARDCTEGPSVLIADTVKGKGVSFMEGRAAWHGKPLSAEDLAKAIAELGGEN
jgi:transketolase